MLSWKKNIFIRAIKARMTSENRTADGIIAEYIALSEAEKVEILAAV